VFNDTTINLIDLFEAAFFHHCANNFAPDSARTVCDDFLVLDIVVFIAFEFFNKITRRMRIGYDRILEFTNLRFVSITPIEEDYVITIFLDHLMNLMRLDMLSSANDAILINVIFIIACPKPNQLSSRFDAHTRKIFSAPIAPLKHDVLKAWVFLGTLDILLEIFHISADRAVYPVFANKNTTAQIKRFRECFLP